MEDGGDEFIAGCFAPYFEKIAFYSWSREPDYCDGYKKTLGKGRQTTWAELVRLYGDRTSEKAFYLEDYKMYLFNNYLEDSGRR